jgi:WD40 repeat protein
MWRGRAGQDLGSVVWERPLPSQPQRLLERHHVRGVEAVTFSPDGRWLATGTVGNLAVLWRLTPP